MKNYLRVAGAASLGTLAASLMCGTAMAGVFQLSTGTGLVTSLAAAYGSNGGYAAAAVAANNNTVNTPPFIYTPTGTLQIGDTVVITLPTGVTFATNPSATVQSTVTASTAGVGAVTTTYNAGNTTMTITVTAAVSGGSDIAFVNGVVLTGAASLATSTGGAVLMAAQATSSVGAQSDATAQTIITSVGGGNGLLSVASLSFTTAPTAPGAASAAAILLTSPSLGSQFTTTAGSVNQLTNSAQGIQTIGVGFAGSSATSPTTAFGLPGNGTLTLTLGGNFTQGYASTYLVPQTTSSCAATPPSAGISGTFNAAKTSATYTIAAGTQYYACFVNTGGFMTSTGTLSASTTATAGSTTIGSASTAAGVGGFGYAGGNVVSFNYVVSAAGGFTSYVRVANTSVSTASSLYASAVTDGGTVVPFSTVSFGSVPANSQALYSVDQIASAIGATAVMGGGVRSRLQIIAVGGTTGNSGVTGAGIYNLLLNNGGIVTNLQ